MVWRICTNFETIKQSLTLNLNAYGENQCYQFEEAQQR